MYRAKQERALVPLSESNSSAEPDEAVSNQTMTNGRVAGSGALRDSFSACFSQWRRGRGNSETDSKDVDPVMFITFVLHHAEEAGLAYEYPLYGPA
jgi:hypothetical protein